MIPRRPPRPPYPNANPRSPAHQPPSLGQPLPPAVLNPPQFPSAAQLLQGTPIDAVYPGRPAVDATPLDGRTAALQSLGVYLTSQPFCRPGAIGGNPVFFGIPPENYFIDRPGPEVDLPFPSIVAVAGQSNFEDINVVTIDKTTKDVYGAGTALINHGEQEETVTLEIWSSTLPELRSIVAGISKSFNPTYERNGFLLAMPNYYGRTARFLLDNIVWQDDPGAVKNRRFAHVMVFVSYDVVRLVNYTLMTPLAQAETEIPRYANPQVVPTNPNLGGAPVGGFTP